jgi:hypothetical protein
MSLAVLRDVLAAQGGTLARVLVDPGAAASGPAVAVPGASSAVNGEHDTGEVPGIGAPQLAARGPRTAAHPEEYELLLEMILEGSLLHYGHPRVVATDDRDLALLLGDQLYALGLARLAELGDLDSVTELSDLISLLSQAQLDHDPALARAIWEAGAAAIGWGSSPEHAAAKQLARAGDPGAGSALRQSAGRDVAQASGARGG